MYSSTHVATQQPHNRRDLAARPLPGQLLHLCVREPGGGLRYIDVWESEQACTRAFEERIHRAVDAAFSSERPAC